MNVVCGRAARNQAARSERQCINALSLDKVASEILAEISLHPIRFPRANNPGQLLGLGQFLVVNFVHGF